jgi:alpha,alpha-trehalase
MTHSTFSTEELRLWTQLDTTIQSSWLDSRRQAGEVEIRSCKDVILPGNPDAQSEDAVASDVGARDTLLFLPRPYLTPGGKEAAFSEMYAWDTFFINQGLLAHDLTDPVIDHLHNQLYMIDRYGMILNGNRTYYLYRSQNPLGAEGARRLLEHRFDKWLCHKAYAGFASEYEGYWTANHHLTPTGLSTARDLGVTGLRPELAAEAEVTDFTAVYDGDVRNCTPLLINTCLAKAEKALAWIAEQLGLNKDADLWKTRIEERIDRINTFLWDPKQQGYFEYNWKEERRLPYRSMAMFLPLWAGIATQEQADALIGHHLPDFFLPHGCPFTDTAYPSPHPEFEHLQWAYPAAWPSFQMLLVEALDAYGYSEQATELATRVLRTALHQYRLTGKLWEKYHALDGGIEIPVERYPTAPMQGWTAAMVAVFGRRLNLHKNKTDC